jgi:GntR family transcriptional regulator
MPLYENTIAFVLQHIREHGLQEGDRLPTETELSASAGVSIVTVRRALAELAAEGVIRREQGRGTFVARPRVRAETTRLGSLRNGLGLDARSSLETRVLAVATRPASRGEAQELGLPQGAKVWEITRLRLLDGRPMIHETSIIPVILTPDLDTHIRGDPARSLYEIMESEYGLREAREEQTLVCRRAKGAEAALLALRRSDWVVEIAGISTTARRVPIDKFCMIFDARGFAFRMETPQTAALQAVELAK